MKHLADDAETNIAKDANRQVITIDVSEYKMKQDGG